MAVNQLNDMLAALAPARPGQGAAVRTSPAARAFQVQMQMAQAVLADPREDRADDDLQGLAGTGLGGLNGPMGALGLSGVTGSSTGDSRLMDALTTIARLTARGGDDPGLSASGRVHVAKTPDLGPDGVEGTLSALFESGSDGPAEIGYDRTGGTSYGTFQIASKPGAMDRFITYLKTEAPDWSRRLHAAGPADTGSARGRMPKVWRAIAAENPERFEALQRDFIKREYYDTARSKIVDRTGFDPDHSPLVLREVLWSTAVQHGPTGAADIFTRAFNSLSDNTQKDFRSLIDRVYDRRSNRFGSSTRRVQQSVADRLTQEKQLALSLLDTPATDRLV